MGAILSLDILSENRNDTEYILSSSDSSYATNKTTQENRQAAGPRWAKLVSRLWGSAPLPCPSGSRVLTAHQGTLGYTSLLPVFFLWCSYQCEVISGGCRCPPGPAAVESDGSSRSRGTSVLPVAFCSHQLPQKLNQTVIPKEHNSISSKIWLQTGIFIAASINWKSRSAGMSETCKSQ